MKLTWDPMLSYRCIGVVCCKPAYDVLFDAVQLYEHTGGKIMQMRCVVYEICDCTIYRAYTLIVR